MRLFGVLFISALLVLAGCTKSTEGSGDKEIAEENGDPDAEGAVESYMTDCGVVSQGLLYNPIAQSAGTLVNVETAGTNLVIVRVPQGRVLVKLQGLDPVEGYLADGATRVLNQLAASGRAWYFQAEPDCSVTTDGGGMGQVGQLITLDGRSYSEELIRSGYASVDSSDVCGGYLIGNCYSALQESSKRIDGEISDFLWKPAGEHDGNLVVLLNPGGATIVVNGVTLHDSGSGNGRGTIARGNQPGCAYGQNVKIRVYSEDDGILLFPGGQEEYTLPDGCARTEF